MARKRRSTLAERSGKGRIVSQAEVKANWDHSSMVRVQRNHQGEIARTTEWKTKGLDRYGNETRDDREGVFQRLEARKKPIPRQAVLDFEKKEGLAPMRIETLIKQNRIVFMGGKLHETASR